MKKTHKIGVIGLGYVGLPLSLAFSKKYKVVGFDIKEERINQLNLFDDITNEIDTEELRDKLDKNLVVTSKVSDLRDCNIFYCNCSNTSYIRKKTRSIFFIKSNRNGFKDD